MGFGNYEEYLASPLWHNIRRRVLERDRRECVCGEVATTVHHYDYFERTLSGHRLKGMISVCQSCHAAAEITPKGRKRTLDEANQFLQSVTHFLEHNVATPRATRWLGEKTKSTSGDSGGPVTSRGGHVRHRKVKIPATSDDLTTGTVIRVKRN